MNTDAALLAELHRLRRAVPEISGAVLAAVDGLLVVSDLPGIDPHHIAALSAAGLGIGGRFANLVGHGPLRESVVRGAEGCVVVYPAGEDAILTTVVHPETDLVRLHAEARPTAQRLGALWDAVRQPTVATAIPPATDPDAPLATRTPMAALPAGLWSSSEDRRSPGRQ
ncbi:roadblock/LC7 domain-containing protein [Plantactinospora sp. ZYX-F-223]|uniref:roadblock/LC7 domain-containing protein n=1 Tax=Plantactinospora sp. ZYX-F-223 TaxID=3144103 RepID=UPI0031FC9582